MKQCKNCNQEFEPKHATRGHEQLYCSITCRNEAYKKRINEKKNETATAASQFIGSESHVQRTDPNFYGSPSLSVAEFLSLVEQKSEARVETIRYKLKCESLQAENDVLKTKVSMLESELNEIDEEDSEDSSDGIIAGFIQEFKKDPITATDFALKFAQGFLSNNQANAKAPVTKKPS